LISNVSLASLLCVAFCGIDMDQTLLGRHHYCFYLLTPAITPRMLYTVDEEGKAVKVSVRVGEAMDVVAQAGNPKSITNFQTHVTPVLMGVNDRANLATEEYEAYTPFLEGVVIMRKKEEHEQENGEAMES
jgi:26S proteasome regulatory subunit N1